MVVRFRRRPAACVLVVPARARVVRVLVPVDRVQVDPADPVGPAARVLVVPVRVPVAQVRAPAVPVVRRWVDRAPVDLAALAQAAAPAVLEVRVVHAPAGPVATVQTANVERRARSRAPVDAGTWMSCNRSS